MEISEKLANEICEELTIASNERAIMRGCDPNRCEKNDGKCNCMVRKWRDIVDSLKS